MNGCAYLEGLLDMGEFVDFGRLWSCSLCTFIYWWFVLLDFCILFATRSLKAHVKEYWKKEEQAFLLNTSQFHYLQILIKSEVGYFRVVWRESYDKVLITYGSWWGGGWPALALTLTLEEAWAWIKHLKSRWYGWCLNWSSCKGAESMCFYEGDISAHQTENTAKNRTFCLLSIEKYIVDWWNSVDFRIEYAFLSFFFHSSTFSDISHYSLFLAKIHQQDSSAEGDELALLSS